MPKSFEHMLLADLNTCKMRRDVITHKYKVSDKHARSTINKLRRCGYRICSDESGDGYWIAKNKEEYETFRRWYKHYADDIYEVIHAMDNMGAMVGCPTKEGE